MMLKESKMCLIDHFFVFHFRSLNSRVIDIMPDLLVKILLTVLSILMPPIAAFIQVSTFFSHRSIKIISEHSESFFQKFRKVLKSISGSIYS